MAYYYNFTNLFFFGQKGKNGTQCSLGWLKFVWLFYVTLTQKRMQQTNINYVFFQIIACLFDKFNSKSFFN